MYAMFLNTYFSDTAGYFLPRGKRNHSQCNSMVIQKLVRSEHNLINTEPSCVTESGEPLHLKKTCKTWTLPFKKKKLGKTFLNCVIHQSSKNFLETDLPRVLYPEALAAINLARYIHAYLMDRFCIVAKDGIKHSTSVSEINFNNKSKDLYMKILEIRIALVFLNHEISSCQNIQWSSTDSYLTSFYRFWNTLVVKKLLTILNRNTIKSISEY